MNNKKDTYYWKSGTGLGIFTLTVGLSIFLLWWGARAMLAHDMYIMEEFGFCWIIISIPIASIGLILNIIFLTKNYKMHLKKALLGIAIILLNIPTAFCILHKVIDINKRTYIQIHNDSLNDLTMLTLKSDYFEKEIGELKANSTKVVYFYPEYIHKNSPESPPPIKPVALLLESKELNITKELAMPYFYEGYCGNIYIDKNYSLLNRKELN